MVKSGTSRRLAVNKKTVKQILERIAEALGGIQHGLSSKMGRVEVARTRKSNVFFFDGKPLFIERRSRIVPSLINEGVLSQLPAIVVDQGAVPFVCNGADVMAPGVRRVEGKFLMGQLVVVREERFHRALAVGSALAGSDEMRTRSEGKVAENIHFVGDDAWQECL